MDIASAVAVHALQPQSNDQILDLCCAPGAKLLLISNAIGSQGTGTITGVDISKNRLYTCRSLLKKYKATSRCRLFLSDGVTFDTWAPLWSINKVFEPKSMNNGLPQIDELENSHSVEDTVQSRPFFAPKTLRHDRNLRSLSCLYDKVLVDAECTHDGSIAHILKYRDNSSWENVKNKIKMTAEQLEELENLQSGVLINGFRLLKPGGILVYSTCSLSRMQNENIVQKFISSNENAILEEIPNTDRFPINKEYPQRFNLPHLCYGVDLSKTIRFDPFSSQTSGLFIARIRKS